jgi:hypothetical protein
MVPVALTENVAFPPAFTLALIGWVLIVGAWAVEDKE